MILKCEKKKISSPEDTAKILYQILNAENEVDRNKEHLWAIGLTTKNNIKYIELVSLGILNAILIHPRETYRLAILKGISHLIIVHNHPSGDTNPSDEDIKKTKNLKEAGDIIGVELLDHIIIGNDNDYYSMREKKDI